MNESMAVGDGPTSVKCPKCGEEHPLASNVMTVQCRCGNQFRVEGGVFTRTEGQG